MIRVIAQTTDERKKETIKLFEEIKPHLDEGYPYRASLIRVGKITPKTSINVRNGWGRDLIEYGEEQGYRYGDHLYHHQDKVGKPRVRSYDQSPLWR